MVVGESDWTEHDTPAMLTVTEPIAVLKDEKSNCCYCFFYYIFWNENKNKTYGKLIPTIVNVVPPPVPPRIGVTDVTFAVKLVW